MSTKRREQTFPLKITVGNSVVKIYRVKTGIGGAWEAYAVADYTSGKRRLVKFADLDQAKREAHRIAVALCNGDSAAAAVDYKDAAALVRCRTMLGGLDVTLETAVEIFAQAARAIGVHRVVEAAKEHAKRFPKAPERMTLSAATDEYHAALEARGRGSRHLSDVRARLGRFLADHPGMILGELTTRGLQAWIDGLNGPDKAPLSPLTRRNFATVVSGMLDYHRRRGRIADNPAADIERPSVRKVGDVQFWNADEAAKLLAAISPEARPALAVGLFCGCRTAEIARLSRSDFDLDDGHVAIGADKAKTASRRLAPIPANLRPWLGDFAASGPSTPLWPSGRADSLTKAVSAACEKAAVRRIDNGARHAWISYRVAETGDVARTALEAGNSPSIVHGNYRGLARKADSVAFFSVVPVGQGRV